MSLYLRQIALVAHELQPAEKQLCHTLGAEVVYRDPHVAAFGLENFLVALGSQFIEVVAPTEEGTAAGRYLDRRGGDGGYMVICQTENGTTQQQYRKLALDLGIRIAWERKHDWGQYMQLHPGDTGGCFLEIDAAEPFEPEGLWPPANGRGWEAAGAAAICSAITAAEIQSDDPGKLAERWSLITGLQRRQEGDILCLDLMNATLRFVEATDGRGEGLGAVDLACAETDAFFDRAKAAGASVQDGYVLICGTRFYPVAVA